MSIHFNEHDVADETYELRCVMETASQVFLSSFREAAH